MGALSPEFNTVAKKQDTEPKFTGSVTGQCTATSEPWSMGREALLANQSALSQPINIAGRVEHSMDLDRFCEDLVQDYPPFDNEASIAVGEFRPVLSELRML